MSPGKDTSELILKIVTKSCKGFKREGNDLIYTMKMSLLSALTAKPFQIETLDGRILKVALDSIVKY
jgi:DnaJ-class molecular chaperone